MGMIPLPHGVPHIKFTAQCWLGLAIATSCMFMTANALFKYTFCWASMNLLEIVLGPWEYKAVCVLKHTTAYWGGRRRKIKWLEEDSKSLEAHQPECHGNQPQGARKGSQQEATLESQNVSEWAWGRRAMLWWGGLSQYGHDSWESFGWHWWQLTKSELGEDWLCLLSLLKL